MRKVIMENLAKKMETAVNKATTTTVNLCVEGISLREELLVN